MKESWDVLSRGQGTLSGVIIAVASEVARRWPGWCALIVSVPLVSVLAMIWLWRDTHDPARLAAHAEATFWFVLPSLPMFLLMPLMLRQGASFWISPGCGLRPDDCALPCDDRHRPEAGPQAMTRERRCRPSIEWLRQPCVLALLLLVIVLIAHSTAAFAHDISESDRAAVAQIEGTATFAFLYLGAKHMVTGIEHILFLIGVIFFLYRLRHVVIYCRCSRWGTRWRCWAACC